MNNEPRCRPCNIDADWPIRTHLGENKWKRKCAVRKKVNREQGSMIKEASVVVLHVW